MLRYTHINEVVESALIYVQYELLGALEMVGAVFI